MLSERAASSGAFPTAGVSIRATGVVKRALSLARAPISYDELLSSCVSRRHRRLRREWTNCSASSGNRHSCSPTFGRRSPRVARRNTLQSVWLRFRRPAKPRPASMSC